MLYRHEKIDIIAEKMSFLVTISALVERSHLYARVQLVEYYQKILGTDLDHSGNEGEGLDGVSRVVNLILSINAKI